MRLRLLGLPCHAVQAVVIGEVLRDGQVGVERRL